MEVLRELPDDSVDIVITDPPYGVRKEEAWDDLSYFMYNLKRWIEECMRVSRNGVIWFCADKMLPFILKDKEFMFYRVLFWNKPAGSQFNGASNNNIWYSLEPILVFMKHPNLKTKGKDSEFSYQFFSARTHKFDDFRHPTAKPYLLMQWLIKHYSDKDDVVLDPFAGSGTTLLACKQLDRKYVGCEINQEYYSIAVERLKQECITNFINDNEGANFTLLTQPVTTGDIISVKRESADSPNLPQSDNKKLEEANFS